MGAGVASSPLPLSYSLLLEATSASPTPASAAFASSPSSRRLNIPSTTSMTQLLLSSSRRFPVPRSRSLRCLCKARFSFFSDEESSNQAEDLTRRLSNDFASVSGDDFVPDGEETFKSEWECATDIPPSIERKARRNSARMLKMKLQLQERLGEAGELADCSIKKAFSSMVFIIREIQSYTLQMKRTHLYEDFRSLQVRIQEDTHAPLVWLFQKVFSQTPTLMVYLMILLANYSVHSVGSTLAIETPPPPSFPGSAASSGKSTSVGGGNGHDGGNFIQGLGGTDREGHFGLSSQQEAVFTDTSSRSPSSLSSIREEESDDWEAIVKEAWEMQAEADTGEILVVPVTTRPEADIDYSQDWRAEALYKTGLSQDPSNQLLLTNFAQFLYLVAGDYDRYSFTLPYASIHSFILK
ncbi:hypothetical protein SAY86_026604 [Trapa natans]|uniref:Uncharacterized protein n=1 Tax=Trapa natans TaxID=22666 RepID=A0AAN7QF18_TRANT|nr:hypothetical protein SAY86_026604 [Trapa natans]